MKFNHAMSGEIAMERDVRIQTDAMMERGMYEGHSVADASAATANQSRRTSGFKSRKGLSRQDSHVDDTHTGGQDHVATSDFLRVMRMLMFLSPNGGWASREGSDCIRRNRRNQKKQPEQYVGWRPRSELDISGHSFRRVIKAELNRIKPGKAPNDKEAKKHLERQRSPKGSPYGPSFENGSTQHRAFWDDRTMLKTASSSCSSSLTVTASPPLTPNQANILRHAAQHYAHRHPFHAAVGHHSETSNAYSQDFIGDDSLREQMLAMCLSEEPGSS